MRKYLGRRKEVLSLLYKWQGNYISGQELSAKLNVSRTTIWKYIKYFRDAGYKIDSSSRLGYKLLSKGDILIPEEVKRNLTTDLIGSDIFHYDELNSTNELAKKKLKSNFKPGTVVITEKQTGGKGRLGRKFYSPQGGIWISVLLSPNLKPVLATRATYLAALAVAETIDQNLNLPVKIKWPNDILINKKKISGILTEMSAELDQINCLIVGIGINANFEVDQVPKNLKDKLTTCRTELGEEIDRVELLQTVLSNLETRYPLLHNFEDLIEEWKKYSLTLGKEVKVIDGQDSYTGKAIDIAEDGGLILQTGRDQKRIYSGEVSLAYN